jgi:hypothetical protein
MESQGIGMMEIVRQKSNFGQNKIKYINVVEIGIAEIELF